MRKYRAGLWLLFAILLGVLLGIRQHYFVTSTAVDASQVGGLWGYAFVGGWLGWLVASLSIILWSAVSTLTNRLWGKPRSHHPSQPVDLSRYPAVYSHTISLDPPQRATRGLEGPGVRVVGVERTRRAAEPSRALYARLSSRELWRLVDHYSSTMQGLLDHGRTGEWMGLVRARRAVEEELARREEERRRGNKQR